MRTLWILLAWSALGALTPAPAAAQWKIPGLLPSPSTAPAAGWRHEPPTAAAPSVSMRRAVGRGALLGAGLGLLTGTAVMLKCGSLCDETRLEGMALHVGVGAAAGAGVGALLHRLRTR